MKKSKIKIAQFNTFDIHGGAAKAAHRLYLGLQKQNIKYFVKEKESDDNNIMQLYPSKFEDNIEYKIRSSYIAPNRTKVSNTLFSFTYNSFKLPDLSDFDIINIHWIEYFLSLENLYEICKLNKPIIWTLHDMKPFTGGCHYSNNCTEFENSCFPCNQLSKDGFELPKKVLALKKLIFSNSNLTVVTPSKWLASEAKKSTLFKDKKIKVIPNSIDSNLFFPLNKEDAKKQLNIDSTNIVLSFGVLNHNESRKGFQELLNSIKLIKNELKSKKVIGLFFGNSDLSDFPIETVNLGQIKDEKMLSTIYSASDIFILPSLEDNFPNTILESLSCETPVIAFNTGGIKDIISNKNGLLVKTGDSIALSKAILDLVNNKEKRIKKGKRGRALILEKYQLSHQATNYIKLYKKLKNKRYQNIVNFNNFKNDILNFTNINYPENRLITFSKYYNQFYSQILSLKNNTSKYLIYGNGTIGKTIQLLLAENIIGFVDINDIYNHPDKIKNLKYDKIIISVLGREKEISEYLIKKQYVDLTKIITINIKRF